MERSKGGFTIKFNAVSDALSNLLNFILTGGQGSDISQAEALLHLTPTGAKAKALLGDKSYDSNVFIQAIQDKGMEPVIPCSNRINPRQCDWFCIKNAI